MARKRRDSGDSPADPVAEVLARVRARVPSAHLLRDGAASDVGAVLPTGIEVLDNAVLGVGGMAAGRIYEVFGGESAGKTSVIYQVVASCQRRGGVALLAETEGSLESRRAAVLGCDLDRVVLDESDSLDAALSFLEASLDALPDPVDGAPVNVVCLDSVAGRGTAEEVEHGMSKSEKIGGRAKMMSQACRVLARLALRKRAVLLLINQTRQKIGVAFGNPTTTPAGDALKFHATARVEIYPGRAIKRGDEKVGVAPLMTAVKNKLDRPWRRARAAFLFETGWNNAWATLDHAKDRGLVGKSLRPTEKNHLAALEALGWTRSLEDARSAGATARPDDAEVEPDAWEEADE